MRNNQTSHLWKWLILSLVFALTEYSFALGISLDLPVVERHENPISAEEATQLRSYLSDMTNATGVLVLKDSKIVFDYGNTTETSYIASCRKSVLAILFGKYVASGKIDLNADLKELKIDDNQGLTDNEKTVTVLDLISSRSGIYHPASNRGDSLEDAPERGTVKPGSYFLYSNWDFNAACTAFEQQIGKSIYESLRDDLAKPLGFQDFDFSRHRKSGDSKRSRHLAYHMHLSTRDKARIGLLMLNKGNWHGRQLFPEDWMERITSPVTKLEEMNPKWRRDQKFGFGLMWWVWDGPSTPEILKGSYTAIGYYGQYLTVIPKVNLVISHKTHSRFKKYTSQSSYLGFIDEVLEVVQSIDE